MRFKIDSTNEQIQRGRFYNNQQEIMEFNFSKHFVRNGIIENELNLYFLN
jgi:hypothetical protein